VRFEIILGEVLKELGKGFAVVESLINLGLTHVDIYYAIETGFPSGVQ
jgi:hypothetical protein